MRARRNMQGWYETAASFVFLGAWAAAGCGQTLARGERAEAPMSRPTVIKGSFGDDLAFLREHTDVVVLGDAKAGARVVVAPGYQGRVMTSTSGGETGPSFGWINREAILAGKRQPHMNVFGGEDRFWLGPEGGQFGLYFAPGAPFDFDHWQVPEAIDWGAWDVAEQTPAEVSFRKDVHLVNRLGTEFSLRVERKVRLLSTEEVATRLGAALPKGTSVVAYESVNTVTNTGQTAWSQDTGLLSIWILGQYRPSAQTTVLLPFRPGPDAELGPVVHDAYFGKVPPERLKVVADVLLFRGDGQERGKIGIPRPRARPVAASYDAGQGVLTMVQYTLPEAILGYVNSMWEEQKTPYGGDVVNSYNDGPPQPGSKPLGPFYEIETSSPAAALAPAEALTHVHRTLHLQGAPSDLDPITLSHLGVRVREIAKAFP
jgi:hypothetical protein